MDPGERQGWWRGGGEGDGDGDGEQGLSPPPPTTTAGGARVVSVSWRIHRLDFQTRLAI
jgi:hypothetical protein